MLSCTKNHIKILLFIKREEYPNSICGLSAPKLSSKTLLVINLFVAGNLHNNDL